MAQEKQNLRFDKNLFTWAMLNAKLYGHEKSFGYFALNKFSEYSGPKNDEELKEAIKDRKQRGNDNDVTLLQYEYELYKNPNSEFAAEFRRYWDFAKYIFINVDTYAIDAYKVLVNSISTFNEDVQLAVLKKLQDKLSGFFIPDNLKETIYIKIANNKYATAYDRLNSAYGLLHKNHAIVRDVIEDLKQELNKELHSDLPNSDTIKTICNQAKNLMISLQDSFDRNQPYKNHIKDSLSKDYIKTVMEEFDISKVLAGGSEYIPQITRSLEERAVNAEREASRNENTQKKYEETNIKLNRLQMEYNENVRQLESERGKTERLTKELNNLQKENEKLQLFVKTIKLKIGTIKAGIFSGGAIKDLQEFVKNGRQI